MLQRTNYFHSKMRKLLRERHLNWTIDYSIATAGAPCMIHQQNHLMAIERARRPWFFLLSIACFDLYAVISFFSRLLTFAESQAFANAFFVARCLRCLQMADHSVTAGIIILLLRN